MFLSLALALDQGQPGMLLVALGVLLDSAYTLWRGVQNKRATQS